MYRANSHPLATELPFLDCQIFLYFTSLCGPFFSAPRCPTNWKQGQRLGSGAFGEVFLCFDHDTGRELAVKMVKVHGVNAEVSKV